MATIGQPVRTYPKYPAGRPVNPVQLEHDFQLLWEMVYAQMERIRSTQSELAKWRKLARGVDKKG